MMLLVAERKNVSIKSAQRPVRGGHLDPDPGFSQTQIIKSPVRISSLPRPVMSGCRFLSALHVFGNEDAGQLTTVCFLWIAFRINLFFPTGSQSPRSYFYDVTSFDDVVTFSSFCCLFLGFILSTSVEIVLKRKEKTTEKRGKNWKVNCQIGRIRFAPFLVPHRLFLPTGDQNVYSICPKRGGIRVLGPIAAVRFRVE